MAGATSTSGSACPNVVEAEAVGYAAQCDQSIALQAGRAANFAGTAPAVTPPVGKEVTVLPGRDLGWRPTCNHNMLRQPFAVPGDIAADIEPATSGSAAIA